MPANRATAIKSGRRELEITPEERLQSFHFLADIIPAAVYTCDAFGRITYYNERAVELWGRKPTADTNHFCGSFQLYHPDGRVLPAHESPMAEAIRTGKRPSPNIEVVMERPDHTYVTALVNVAPIKDAQGRIIGAINCFQDITPRKQAENALKKQKEILEKIFEHIPVMIAAIGKPGRIDLANPEWERVLGWTLQEIREQKVNLFTEACPDPQYRQMVLDFVTHSQGAWKDLKIRVRDGRFVDLAVTMVHLSDGTAFAIAQDITERKRTEQKIQEDADELRELSSRLRHMQDEERRRIARELHDTTGQNLAALAISLASLRKAGSRLNARERDVLERSLQLARKAAREISAVTYLLHPPMLDQFGLVETLRWYVRGFSRRSGILVTLALSPKLSSIPKALEHTIFHVVQEGLNNILRHSRSKRARILVSRKDGKLELQIRDFGRGLPATVATQPVETLGVGIAGMLEHVRCLGGDLRLSPARPGALLRVTLPIAKTKESI